MNLSVSYTNCGRKQRLSTLLADRVLLSMNLLWSQRRDKNGSVYVDSIGWQRLKIDCFPTFRCEAACEVLMGRQSRWRRQTRRLYMNWQDGNKVEILRGGQGNATNPITPVEKCEIVLWWSWWNSRQSYERYRNNWFALTCHQKLGADGLECRSNVEDFRELDVFNLGELKRLVQRADTWFTVLNLPRRHQQEASAFVTWTTDTIIFLSLLPSRLNGRESIDSDYTMVIRFIWNPTCFRKDSGRPSKLST